MVEEDEDLIEIFQFNGTKKKAKHFTQKCVICYERDGDYAFNECGHYCICEQIYQNKGDIVILKCFVCRI